MSPRTTGKARKRHGKGHEYRRAVKMLGELGWGFDASGEPVPPDGEARDAALVVWSCVRPLPNGVDVERWVQRVVEYVSGSDKGEERGDV